MEADDSRDLGNWLQGFLPWKVPDGLYTTIAPNFFAIVHDLTSRYPKSDEVALSRGPPDRPPPPASPPERAAAPRPKGRCARIVPKHSPQSR